MNRLHALDQPETRGIALVATPPVVEAASGDPQHAAEYLHRIARLLRLDEPKSQFDSFAKKAVAFFKISRSILSLRTSSRSRRSSASFSASFAGRAEVTTGFSPRSSRRQRFRQLRSTPSRRAASVSPYPSSSNSLTASALNSAVYRRHVSLLINTSSSR